MEWVWSGYGMGMEWVWNDLLLQSRSDLVVMIHIHICIDMEWIWNWYGVSGFAVANYVVCFD